MSYNVLKAIHVIAVVLFVGNVVVTAFWKGRADLTRDVRVVVFGQRLVTLTDYLFTGPAAVLVLATGFAMLPELGGMAAMRLPWIHIGLGLFMISALVWGAVLIPIQIKQSRIVGALRDGDPIPERYWKLGRLWMRMGGLALVPLLAAIVLMVTKPV